MQRYSDSIQEIITNGKKRYETLYYPSFPLKDSDIYIITKKTDRLDLLADQYYGDPRFWWIISKSNNIQKGTLKLESGIKIRIPYPLDEFEILETVRENQF